MTTVGPYTYCRVPAGSGFAQGTVNSFEVDQ
jgi:hypothetical protein